MLTKKIKYNRYCFKYFIFFMLLLMTLVASIQTTTIQAGVPSLSNHSDHHPSLPFFSTITRGFNYAMFIFAITNLVTQSQSSHTNNQLMSCPPNEKGLIPLGQENFTECLQQNSSGLYLLVSPINFSNFSDAEKMHYPMYNFTSPFQGALDTGNHYISDLYLNRTGISALFGAIANSNFHVQFKNPYVMGTNHTAVLAAMARGHNTINMTVDHATAITVCPPHISCTRNDNIFNFSGATAIVLGNAQDSHLSLFFKAQSTHTQTQAPCADAGIVVGRLSDSSINMNVNTNFSQLTTSGDYSYAGAVGFHNPRRNCPSCHYFFKAQTDFNTISLFSGGTFSAAGATVGGILGYRRHNPQYIGARSTINSKINTITIHASGNNSSVSACIGRTNSHVNTLNLSINNADIVTLNEGTRAALAIGYSSLSSNNIFTKANTLTSNHTGKNTRAGGIVGYLRGFQHNYLSTLPPQIITAAVNKVLISNTEEGSATGMMIGSASLKNEILNLWLQAGQANLLTNATPSALAIGHLHGIVQGSYAVIGNVVATVNGQPSAIGVGSLSMLPSNENLAILFIAGQAELFDSALILQPGTCPYSLIDQSGINVNIDKLGCPNARVVQSIEPQGWRSAMARLQTHTLSITTPKLSLPQ